MTFNPSYLIKSNHGIYYLRYPLPKTLHPQGKRSYIKFSLKTYSKQEALAYADTIRYAGRIIIQRLQRANMNYIEKKKIISDYFRNLFEKTKSSIHEEGLLTKESIRNREALVDMLLHMEKCGQRGMSIMSPEELERLCEENNIPLPETGKERNQIEDEYTKGVIKLNKDVLALNALIASPDYFDISKTPSPSTAQHKPITVDAIAVEDKESLAHVLSKYFSEHNKLWSPTTKRNYNTYRSFLDKNTDTSTAINLFEIKDARSVRDALEVITNKNNKTKNKYITFYSQFFKWCRNNGYTEHTFFDGMTFKEERQKESEAMRAFTREELNLMQDALLQNNIPHKEHDYWVTLIGIYTGARMQEITQLYVDDIKKVDGVWVISINDDKEFQKLKNETSRREIPIHSKLIELGLIKYKRKIKEGFLFPDLSYEHKGDRNRKVSRWFNGKFLTGLNIKSKQVDFHSLRRSMSTILNQVDITEPKIASILGHAQQSMVQRYNTEGFTIKQLQEVIERFKIDT